MHFGASANDAGAALNPYSSYSHTDPSSLSGIYRTGVGEYVVVLDGSRNTVGNYSFHGSSSRDHLILLLVLPITLMCGQYNLQKGSTYQSIINNFSLYKDKFFAITEPLLLKTTNKLLNKKIVLGLRWILRSLQKYL